MATRTALTLTLLLLLEHLLVLGVLLGGEDFLQFGIHGFLILFHLLAACLAIYLLVLLAIIATCFHLFATLEIELIYRFVLLLVKVECFLQTVSNTCSHIFGLKLAALGALGKQAN